MTTRKCQRWKWLIRGTNFSIHEIEHGVRFTKSVKSDGYVISRREEPYIKDVYS